MKIVSYQGGLGNQMFQYAFQKRLEYTFPEESILAETFSFENYDLHQGFELESIFNIALDHCSKEQLSAVASVSTTALSKVKTKLFGRKKSEIFESELQKFSFDTTLLRLEGDRYFFGYWQSHQYIDPVRDKLLEDFTLRTPLDTQNMKTIQAMRNSNSISLHVRRGDYINHPNFGGICDLQYYKRAIRVVEEKVKSPSFFVFSDDIDWCKENIPLENATYINWNVGKNSFLDMILMSNCQNNIIANSSFSWWGAYLNTNHHKIVVAPSKWKNNMDGTRDLLPNSWITVSTDS